MAPTVCVCVCVRMCLCEQELEDLGLGDSGEDVSVGLWGEGRERYAMSTPTNLDNIKQFVEVSPQTLRCVVVSHWSSPVIGLFCWRTRKGAALSAAPQEAQG